jgi:predicted MFS family arabinose efflux permease
VVGAEEEVGGQSSRHAGGCVLGGTVVATVVGVVVGAGVGVVWAWAAAAEARSRTRADASVAGR